MSTTLVTGANRGIGLRYAGYWRTAATTLSPYAARQVRISMLSASRSSKALTSTIPRRSPRCPRESASAASTC